MLVAGGLILLALLGLGLAIPVVLVVLFFIETVADVSWNIKNRK